MDNQKNSVNFYILPDSNIESRHFFIFRLVEKAYQQAMPLAIITADEQQSAVIDRLLWTAKPERFIAHEIISSETKSNTQLPSIIIAHDNNTIHALGFKPQIAIDISYDGTPLDYPKVMLIANQHTEILNNARMKYQSYVNQGIKPQVYKIKQEQLEFS